MRLRIVECSQPHLDKCAEHHVVGVADEPFTDWKSGDWVVLAVAGELAALAKVRGLPYEEKRRLWPDDVYPYRVQVEFERRLAADKRLPLAGAVRQALSEAWGAADDAALAAGLRSRRLVSGPQAEVIVSSLREERVMNPQEAPPQPMATDTGTRPTPAVEPAPDAAASRLVLRNCGRGNDCGQGWDDLVKTELPAVRFCTRCERAVYQCTDGDALMASLRKGRCVAIEDGD